MRVSVWWDFENCGIPNGVNVCRLAPRVAAALRAAGIRGPLSITAFGDVLQLSRSAQEALAATGVAISHVPRSYVLVPAPPTPLIVLRSVSFPAAVISVRPVLERLQEIPYHMCSRIKNDDLGAPGTSKLICYSVELARWVVR